MQTLNNLYVSAGNWLAQVPPIPPDENNVPPNVRETVEKLTSGTAWVMTTIVFLFGVLFLALAAIRPKQRGSYVVSALVAFGIGTFMATPSGQAYVQDLVDFFIT